MPYRFMVDAYVDNEPKYKTFLRPREMASHSHCEINIKLTNSGDAFPGGKVKNVVLLIPVNFMEITSTNEIDLNIPELKINETFGFKFGVIPIVPGFARITVNLEAIDGQKIEYVQSGKGPILENTERFLFFYIVESHILEELLLLEELAKRR